MPTPVPSPNAQIGRLRRGLRMVLAAVAVAALVAVGIDAEVDRREALAEATSRTESTARLLEQHIRQTFHGTDVVLREAIALTRRIGHSADQTASRRLHDLESGLPELGRLLIFDAEGTLQIDSRAFPPQPFSIAATAHFKAHRDGVPFAVDAMAHASIGDCLHFTVSRRIDDEAGHMVGVAVAAIDATKFADFHQALALGDGGVIGVFTKDGSLVLRQPEPDRFERTGIAGGAVLRAAAEAPQGVLPPVASPLDGVERIIAYRVLDDTGMVAVTGISLRDALAGWWRTRMVIGGTLALFALVLAAVAVIASRALTREEAMMRDLEAVVAERTEESRRLAEEARRANDGKTRFLAAASHDLRQPLQAVVDKLRQSIEATGTLLSTLLDITTLESGKVRPNITAFPVMPLLASLADQMEPEATARGLRLTVADSSAWVISDRVLLERLLRNLLVNALRYTAQGGVLLGCRRRPGERLAIEVVDTGIGIPTDKQDVIFEDFARLDGDVPVSGGGRGPGLGLGVARRMAHLLGHRIELRSAVGKGSTFGVVVPAARPRRVE